jgi:hypothetical protein
MRPTLTRILIASALAAGCGGAERRGTVGVTPSPPDPAGVEPCVQVIADYEEPMFYSEGAYWWFFGGSWYRATTYAGGWTRMPTPPAALAQSWDRAARKGAPPDVPDPRSNRYREYY